MIISLLSYPAAAAGLVLLLLCVTLGLYQICDWIEARPVCARAHISRLIYASCATILIAGLGDRLSLPMLLTCLLAQLVHLAAIRTSPDWPFPSAARRTDHRGTPLPPWLLTTLAFLLSLAAHLHAVSTFHSLRSAWADYHRPFHPAHRLPGGRVDWDALDPDKHVWPRTPEMRGKEVVTFIALGIWLTPAVVLLGLCAGQMGLPTTSAAAGGTRAGSRRPL